MLPHGSCVCPTVLANAVCVSNIPNAPPTAILSPNPIPIMTSFGCVDIAFRSFCFINIFVSHEPCVVYNAV